MFVHTVSIRWFDRCTPKYANKKIVCKSIPIIYNNFVRDYLHSFLESIDAKDGGNGCGMPIGMKHTAGEHSRHPADMLHCHASSVIFDLAV